MAKPTLFIGSSTENKNLALAVQSSLQYDVFPVVWTQGTFEPSHFALESLEGALDIADFAVLVCAPDDLTTIREQQYATVRDNVIFELGMFIGRLSRKRTFLISPRGVELHLPSDLNGISPETFDPEQLSNPEAALGPACSKIRGAIQKLGPLPRGNTTNGAESAGNSEPAPPAISANSDLPMSEWKLQDFEIRYFIALSSQRLNRTTEIDQGFLVSPYSVSPESLAIWNAWKQIAAMFADKGVDMALLRNQVDLFPQESRLHEFLGQALLHYGDQKGASEAFAVAAELASDPASVARVLNRILDLDSPFTKTVGATHLRERLLGLKLSNHSDKSAFVDAMKAIALAHKLEEVALALSEVHVSLNPEDVASRFDLAWKYLNGSQFGLSMTHYEAIPSSDRSGTIWNNLGVNYARLQMNGKAVSAYQMAAEKAESIAQGNIAQKLVGAGFLDEAQTRAEAAVSVEGHHESIIEVLASIKSSRELEDKTHKAKQEEARSEQDIRLAIGRAALSSGGPNPIGIWSTADGLIEIMENLDGTYTGTGEAIRETHGRALGLFRGQKMIEKHRVVVSLTRFGNALEGSLVWEASERPVNLLGTINSTRKLLLMISDDGSSIEGFEISYDMKQVQWKRPLAITADAGHQLTEA